MKLTKVVRDRDGFLHKPSEQIQVLNQTNHANFDERKLLNVVFINTNTTGAVFSDEIEEN